MKRIVVCLDGTWNNDDLQTEDTNVALISRAIHGSQGSNGILQIVLYLRGVGTTGTKIDTLYQGAIGLGVDDNIRSAYQFIAQNYVPGDEIYLFGFSRGSFTARSLAGWITACSILKRQSLGFLPNAWMFYREAAIRTPLEFTREFPAAQVHDGVKIQFVGVWDTVGSLGIPSSLLSASNQRRYGFHDTTPSRIVLNGFHAMAIDEHRHDFTPTYWTGKEPEGCNITQVWFAGAHSDVGGGYVTRKQADIPLLWMAKQAESVGLAIDWDCLPKVDAVAFDAPIHDSASGVFALDHYRPTFRQIGGKAFNLGLNETVYVPVDANNHPTSVINERIHSSVVRRFGSAAQTCADDPNGVCSLVKYAAKNLEPLFITGKFDGLPTEG